jgi:hypothetical protein
MNSARLESSLLLLLSSRYSFLTKRSTILPSSLHLRFSRVAGFIGRSSLRSTVALVSATLLGSDSDTTRSQSSRSQSLHRRQVRRRI